MKKNRLKLYIFSALLMSSAAAVAMPFDSFDPRSMAMGGTGVAVGDPSTAPFFNPAMLTASDPSKKYSIEFPIIGVQLYDPGNLHNNLQTLSTDINTMTSSITTVQNQVNTLSSLNASTLASNPAQAQTQLTQLQQNLTTVSNNINTVNSKLASLSNQPLQGELGAATVIGIPGKSWGFAVYADGWAAIGGLFEYKDSSQLNTLSGSVSGIATTVSQANTAVSNCAALPANQQAACYTTAAAQVSNAVGVSNISSPTLQSKIHIRGVAVEEVGMSISHNLVTSDHSWSLGFTPKVMDLTLFDALLSADNGNSTSGVTGNDYTAKYNTVNLDMGVAKSYNNGWRTGVVVKNVIPQSYNFMAIAPGAASGSPQQVTGTLKMNPEARLGVSHENAWSAVAFDLDMTKNDPAGLENPSQYAGIGGELSAWGWAQIRAGYKSDLLNKGQDLISLGFGLSPRIPYFKPHLDLAITASRDVLSNGWNNATQAGASLKLGFNF